MRRKPRHKRRLAIAAAVATGCLMQTSTCSTSSSSEGIAQQWTLSVVETLIAGYVTDQFNLTQTTF